MAIYLEPNGIETGFYGHMRHEKTKKAAKNRGFIVQPIRWNIGGGGN
jgi:hypothetical protein